MAADVSVQWSWASSAARIPQIFDLTVALSEEVEHARISVSVADADLQFGAKVVFEGGLPAGTSVVDSVHVPLSARLMSQVEDRRGAQCAITLEDSTSGRILARVDQALDLQPRDLWLWDGDPRAGQQRVRLEQRLGELSVQVAQDPTRADTAASEAEIARLSDLLHAGAGYLTVLARSLLASFVRPNHPEIAVVARDAAARLGRATGDESFFAFQISDLAKAEKRADDSVDAIYEALRARAIAYSEPPPGWDYTLEGQRIRDHGQVATGGLGTCMDTTVLTAAVIEQVGLLPVLVLVPGHIFVGYWRREPLPQRAPRPEWYPDAPVVSDMARIGALVEGGWLGLIETTAFTAGKDESAANARASARQQGLMRGVSNGSVTLIDVAAARRAGVSPLPAINERPDGVTEIVEYRPGSAPAVTEVATSALDQAKRVRQVDHHPVRYRTWKSSLFSLNATNALLNLGSNARVQPLVLPPEGLGLLEDRLNQDVSFSLHSGYDVPAVWHAREIVNAHQLLESGEPDGAKDLMGLLKDRKVFVQRFGRSSGRLAPSTQASFVKELRSMAHNAKSARDERGMNPLFLCIGLLRWPHKPGELADAPLILVPVNMSVARGRQEFSLSLDTSQQTEPNVALIEWLRREHTLVIPGLSELLTDHAGIDVDGVLAEVRTAVSERGLPFDVSAQARLATLDLASFRMWQDLNKHGDGFLQRSLVRHLVDTPTEQFEDPAVAAAGDAAGEAALAEELETLETPIPADSTQKLAVLWAKQGRTFVLQGPPGTGKSQTITNMVAECVLAGLRVLFVAEKGTALSVVQRRLDAIGLGPFTLNLHQDGANATEVRAQLKRALTATTSPDPTAMENARRLLRTARFELMQYPQQLHQTNTAGLSAYSAHDQLLVLGEGPVMPVPTELVAYQGEKIDDFRHLFQNLQQWTAAAGVRPDHPWRLAGAGDGEPFAVDVVARAVRGVLDGTLWAASTGGALHDALAALTHPAQLHALAAAASRVLPQGEDLARVLSPGWPLSASGTVSRCEQAVQAAAARLHGFAPAVLDLDLRAVAAHLAEARVSGIFGRGKRVTAAVAPLLAVDPSTIGPDDVGSLLAELIAAQDARASVLADLRAVAGLAEAVPPDPFAPEALRPARQRLDALVEATAGLRDGAEWTEQVLTLARGGHLASSSQQLSSLADAWQQLWSALTVHEADFQAWRAGGPLLAAVTVVGDTWRRQADFERLLPLQNWCTLVRKLEPLRAAGMAARVELLEGTMPAYVAEDALARGVAQTSLKERTSLAGLDRFNAVAHDQRVTSYAGAEEEVRRQWVTEVPATLLARRGGGGAGAHTGGLARELEKTTRRLGIRPILRTYGEAIQELTPLVLCSPSSVVDFLEPGVMDFDVVIFDEASQITVPEAIGALGRARAAIVVGDSKQMPPSRKIGGGGGNEDEELDAPDAVEVVEDQESILSECELARVPTLRLDWHYRSQDESLIAFSNRAYYRGALSSFPTPTLMSSETGLEFRRVQGQYLRAGSGQVDLGNGVVAASNTNPVEALEIVRAVHELVARSDRLPSVGIVTFNEQQRQLIEDLLQASPDPGVAEVMDEQKMGRGEALFVKALEQVQGDERDVIIFSIAFSKQANGRIPTNFGPITNSGGERRLNVAITRARRKNIVFCSFDPAELDVSSSTYNGPKDLKEFLAFTKASDTSDPGEQAHRVPMRDRHRDDLAEALRQAGLHVMSDVGLSDFRLDLVLARPADPTRPLLPVLLDGESWRRRRTVSDRDVLPVEVLQNLMGWPTVARVWWPMWLQNRQEVIDHLLAEVDRAEARLVAVAVPPPALVADVEPSAAKPSLPGVPLSAVRAATGSVTGKNGDEPSSPDPSAAPGVHHETALMTVFAPADETVVGPRSVLDALPDRAAAAVVREQVLDVIEAEGPIESARLARIVARRFALVSVRAARIENIINLIPRGQLRTSTLGSFAWPTGLDPATWRSYRSPGNAGSRPLDEVPPEEIANAMRVALGRHPDLGEEDLLRAAADAFGISRLGPNVRLRLVAVAELLAAEPAAIDPVPSAAPSTSSRALGPGEVLTLPGPAVLTVELQTNPGSGDLDVSVVLLDENQKARQDSDLVFYNAPVSPAGAVQLASTDSVDGGIVTRRVSLDLDLLPQEGVTRCVVGVSSAVALGGGQATMLLRGAIADDLLLPLPHEPGILAAVVLEVYLRQAPNGPQWRIRGIGQGWRDGLAGLVRDYGVIVD